MVNKNFLIAEAGINHNGNIRTALKLVDTAKKVGRCYKISNLYHWKKGKKKIQENL